MASVPFSLAQNVLVDNSVVTSNGIHAVYNSGPQTNSGDYPAIKVVVEYDTMLPDPNAANLANYSLSAVVEGEDSASGSWFPLIRQFQPLINPNQGLRQILVAAPNIFTFEEGRPIDDWDGEKVTTRTHKTQDRLTDKWRVCVHLLENRYGEADAFQSVNLTIYGNRYNV